MEQDNDAKHSSKYTTEWLKKKNQNKGDAIPQSPDFNLIEMLQQDLDGAVHK